MQTKGRFKYIFDTWEKYHLSCKEHCATNLTSLSSWSEESDFNDFIK